jgi:hypothetical protein
VLPDFDGVAEQGQRRAAQMVDLYGAKVLPGELMSFFNRRLGVLEHISGRPREECCATAFRLLSHHCLECEEHPVVTRFWRFTECVFTLLRMKLIGMPAEVFSLLLVKPREEGAKRLKAFKAFYVSELSDQRIRVSAVSLQLTLHSVSITAKASEPGGDPALVQLAKGVVQEKTSRHLQELLPKLQNDKDLNVDRAVYSLFVTMGEICIRFAEYVTYPGLLWPISRKYNPGAFVQGAAAFLELDENVLDAGGTQSTARGRHSNQGPTNMIISKMLVCVLDGPASPAQVSR